MRSSPDIRQSLRQNPYRWSVKKTLITLIGGLLIATVLGVIKVSLRYDSNESERWWLYYFNEQLVSWGQWVVWIPVLITVTNWSNKRIRSSIVFYAAIFISSILIAAAAATIEGLAWHTFVNQSVDWPWFRVWKAFLSNQLGFHFLIAATLLLLLVIRQIWWLLDQKKVKVMVRESSTNSGSLVLNHRGYTEFIPFSDITHLRASGSYVEIHTHQSKKVITGSLKQFTTQLPDSFVRIHRSYIVKVDAIESLTPLSNDDYRVITAGGHELRLSRSYKDSLPKLRGE
ncbi:MAG: LytTR family transcriptional regulator [Cyclobacteriaceae bacterium]|nr:LytTR family transcriptional regulator [Cyclobacteriaceae bacterium]